MAESLLNIQHLNKHFGGVQATAKLSLAVKQGELHAIIGPNGAGKTTLLNLITGVLPADSGHIYFEQRDISQLKPYQRARLGLGRSYQITSVFLPMTLLENMTLALQAQQGHAFRFWSPVLQQNALVEVAIQKLTAVGLEAKAKLPASALSHGEHRQLEMALTLATAPKLLLLDEPMAGLSSEENQRMIDFIKQLKRRYTVVLIEHDMQAVFQLADRISVLVNGDIIATDSPEAIRHMPEVQQAYLGGEASPC